MRKFVYRVGKNETLASVSAKYGVPLSALVDDNGLTDRDAYEGMRLIICQRGGSIYVVKPFDTLEKLAVRFGVGADEIRANNGIDGRADVFLGQKIFIPAH